MATETDNILTSALTYTFSVLTVDLGKLLQSQTPSLTKSVSPPVGLGAKCNVVKKSTKAQGETA